MDAHPALTHTHSAPAALGLGVNQSLPMSMLAGFESVSANAESSSSRRQRISMACQYCRHRKIRCCGGAPCRNCTRSSRECEYTPVPEEVNRATREKKAVAKANKPAPTPSPSLLQTATFGQTIVPSPMTAYSPYFLDVPTFDVPATSHPEHQHQQQPRPAHLGHRRSSSTPNYASASWTQPPPAPLLNSPAQLESSAWMYNNWSSGPPVPAPAPAPMAALPVQVPAIQTTTYTPPQAFPSVFEPAAPIPVQHAPYQPPHMVMSTPMPSAASMPNPAPVPAPAQIFQHRMPLTPAHSRSNSMSPLSGTHTPPYQTSGAYVPTTPSTYLAPPASTPGAQTAYKGLTVQTQAPALPVSASYPAYPYSPPVSPGSNAYYTPYATPSLYSSGSSSANTAPYTPSPPAHAVSPTLAPEMPAAKEELVGLGLGMGVSTGYGGYAPGSESLGVHVIEQDVFYTPNMGSDAYFPTTY